MNRNNTRYRALLAAIGAAAITSFAGVPVLAADTAKAKAAPVEELTEVVITGSILRRTDTETPSPVTVMTAEDLQQRGISTVAEAIQRISANGAGTMTAGWGGTGSNFAGSANAPSLRGLTVQATLSVVDGSRMAVYPFADDGHRNFVDLNSIPDSVVERVEVLRDGASSTYGADAIAGVVNVITKKQITGTHVNASLGSASRGGGAEKRLDASWGTGELNSDRYNFYVAAEYRKTDPIWARDLGYPFNSSNLSGVCDSAGHCLANGNNWGITSAVNAAGQPYTIRSGSTFSLAAIAAPFDAAGNRLGVYRLLNPSAGCNVEPGLFPVTLTAALAGTTYDPNQCGMDRRKQFGKVQGENSRVGGFTRFTAKIGDSSEFYVSASYYRSKDKSNILPRAIAEGTTPPNDLPLNLIQLPIYVCAGGVGVIDQATGQLTSRGCTNALGAPVAGATLNPNNPFAAAGQYADLRWRYDRAPTVDSDAKSTRFAAGLSGTFGSDWTYSSDLTYSKVQVALSQANYLVPQRLADAIARGTFNFVNPLANSEAARDFVFPTNLTDSFSEQSQAQATIGKKLLDLAGGPMQAAVGLSYRREKLFQQSANPGDLVAAYNRYATLNAVGASGTRNVQSAFFEADAPFVKQFEANLSGRYDKYSSGQKNFSPKLGVKYKPLEQLVLRGTYSKGFRIPSFNEAYGLPTTGYTNDQVDCATYVAFCNAHGGATQAYVANAYSLGETSVGNSSLNAEKSTSYTLGVVFEPVSNVSITVDYWNIEVKDLIAKLSGAERSDAIDQYYRNNGVVNIPGVTVSRGTADPNFPNALPLLGFVTSSFNNADKENASGFDLGINATTTLAGGVKLTTGLEASYLKKYAITRKDGSIERYQGTLSPCDYTSCSGSPTWRGSFTNTAAWEKFSVTGTVYYTSGYNTAEIDYFGDAVNCDNNDASDGSPNYFQTSIPVKCGVGATWNIDLNAKYKFSDKLTLYFDALNAFNIQPTFDPAATYSITQYNVAWGQPNAIGRFLRIGLKADF
jgi:iron complex outermembrane recepter protein